MAKSITLDVLSSQGCAVCKKFEELWHTVEKDWPNVTYRHLDLLTPEGQEMVQKYMIFASPGIIINGELFSSGGFDQKAFIEKLKQLSA